MLDPEIAVQLRRRGWDVESIQGDHRDLLGQDDITVLKRAKEMGRVLVTDNVRHFVPLHEWYVAQHEVHAGLLLTHPRTYPRSKRTVGLWVEGLEQTLKSLAPKSTDNLYEWLRPPRD